MEVDHALDDFVGDLNLFHFGELLALFVELIEEAAVLEVLSHEDELVGRDADAHVEHDVGVLQVADDHDFLHEVLFVVVLARFHIVFDGDLLTDVLALVDFAVAALSDELQLLQVLFLNQELQSTMVFQELIKLSNLSVLMRASFCFFPGQFFWRT